MLRQGKGQEQAALRLPLQKTTEVQHTIKIRPSNTSQWQTLRTTTVSHKSQVAAANADVPENSVDDAGTTLCGLVRFILSL